MIHLASLLLRGHWVFFLIFALTHHARINITDGVYLPCVWSTCKELLDQRAFVFMVLVLHKFMLPCRDLICFYHDHLSLIFLNFLKFFISLCFLKEILHGPIFSHVCSFQFLSVASNMAFFLTQYDNWDMYILQNIYNNKIN